MVSVRCNECLQQEKDSIKLSRVVVQYMHFCCWLNSVLLMDPMQAMGPPGVVVFVYCLDMLHALY